VIETICASSPRISQYAAAISSEAVKEARKAVRAAQKQFERESSATNKLRRKAFAQAQKEGLSLREIGEEVGLTHSPASSPASP
jgi:DNA-directed RNA polymerase specialized sigma24 family protein